MEKMDISFTFCKKYDEDFIALSEYFGLLSVDVYHIYYEVKDMIVKLSIARGLFEETTLKDLQSIQNTDCHSLIENIITILNTNKVLKSINECNITICISNLIDYNAIQQEPLINIDSIKFIYNINNIPIKCNVYYYTEDVQYNKDEASSQVQLNSLYKPLDFKNSDEKSYAIDISFIFTIISNIKLSENRILDLSHLSGFKKIVIHYAILQSSANIITIKSDKSICLVLQYCKFLYNNSEQKANIIIDVPNLQIEIKNSTFNAIWGLKQEQIVNKLTVDNCTFQGILNLKANSIEVQDLAYDDNRRFSIANIDVESLSISSRELYDIKEIKKSSINALTNESLTITDSTFGKFYISGLINESLQITDSTFKLLFMLNKSNLQECNLYRNTLKGHFILHSNIIKNTFSMLESTMSGIFLFSSNNLSNLYINNISHNDKSLFENKNKLEKNIQNLHNFINIKDNQYIIKNFRRSVVFIKNNLANNSNYIEAYNWSLLELLLYKYEIWNYKTVVPHTTTNNKWYTKIIKYLNIFKWDWDLLVKRSIYGLHNVLSKHSQSTSRALTSYLGFIIVFALIMPYCISKIYNYDYITLAKYLFVSISIPVYISRDLFDYNLLVIVLIMLLKVFSFAIIWQMIRSFIIHVKR